MKMVTDILDELSWLACEAMLPGGFTRAGDGAEEPEGGLVSVIGFSGDRVRGVLGVTAPPEAIAATHPLAGTEPALRDEQLYDWVAELANQLLGRIKGGLMDYGVTLWLASPVVLRGVSVRIVPRPEEGVKKFSLRGRAGDLCVWVDFQFDEALELERVPDHARDHCVAGEMLLF
ncbi:MAG: chemotaxis protein CheX [Myxococcales bacterium]|nr:chemotaxis protein CheX [Myxococcales bacterium]